MVKRLTFQERALERSRLATRLLDAIRLDDDNPQAELNIKLVYYRKVVKEVIKDLLKMK